MVQAETEVLPLADVEMPTGQEVHVDAPTPAYAPAGQSEHPPALTVPGSVTVPAYPGAQMVHAETEVLPVEEPVV